MSDITNNISLETCKGQLCDACCHSQMRMDQIYLKDQIYLNDSLMGYIIFLGA